MRKHSLRATNSHQNLKDFLAYELTKKTHYLPRGPKRDVTKPKKHLLQLSNLLETQPPPVRRPRKTRMKNSHSYHGCNTSLE